MIAYGHEFPDYTNTPSIELWCYRNWAKDVHGFLPRHIHFKNAISSLWPESMPNGDKGYIWSEWADRRLYGWVYNEFQTWWGPSSSGKASPSYTPVYTPDGPVAIGTVKVGDRVIDHSGKTSKVLQVHDRGLMEIYEVSFNDGTSLECAKDHLWEVDKPSDKWRRPKLIDTQHMYNMQDLVRRLKIPLCEPAYFTERSVEISPYIMGALLGDGALGGTKGQSSLTFTCHDSASDIVDRIRSLLDDNYSFTKYGEMAYRLTKSNRKNRGKNDYIQALKGYSLWTTLPDTKFIPEDYLYNSVENRIALLQGLMDTDGYISANGAISFCSVSKALADGVCEIVRSLGGIARVSTKDPWFRDSNGNRKAGKLCYIISIILPDESIAFSTKKKFDRVRCRTKGLAKYVDYVTRTGRSAHMICITIDNPRGLYVSKDYIVTHNSTDAGVFLLTDWLADPEHTTAMVISTTKDMLEKRIWREIVRFHSMYKGRLPGHQYKHSIVYEDPSSDAGVNTINGIFAHAVQKGSVAQAMGNIIGIHNDHNILVIDEMQATREAAAEAYDNLSTGKSSKFLGMGNPVSRLDPLGRASEPKKGWHTISPAVEQWETKRGVTLYFDGLKSPALDNPDKYFFLLNKKQIDMMRQDPGEDSPRFWSQRRGFVPPEGLTETVLTESFIEKFKIMQPAMWKNDYQIYLGCDPSFSSGGDGFIITPFKVGVMTNGMTGIEFMTPITINLKISTGEPKTYFLAGETIKLLDEYGITPNEFSMDCTGAQRSLADVIEMEWYKIRTKKDYVNTSDINYPRINRVEFGGKASDLVVSFGNNKKASECYSNRVTELWYTFREFVCNDQIRGMGNQAIKEFCSRNLDDKLSDSRNLTKLETKKNMKARTGGKSPDTADSAITCVDYVRSVLGIMPGTGNLLQNKGFSSNQMQNFDMDGGENLYADEPIW